MFRMRRPGRGITILVGLHGAAFLATYVLGAVVSPDTSLLGILALDPAMVFEGRIWQLVTSVLFHAPGDVLGVLVSCLWLALLGPQVEDIFGTRKLLTTYAWTGMGSVALTMVVGVLGMVLPLGNGWSSLWGTVHIGPTGAILGLIACWVALMGRNIVHFALLGPMQARTFGLILLAGVLLIMFIRPDVSSSMHLGGMFVGYAVGAGKWPPNRRKRRLEAKKKQLEQELRRFEVIEGGRAGQPRNPDERPRGWTGWNDGGPIVH